MKLWIFKNRINVTEATFCIQNLLCGNMIRNFKMVPFCSLCDVSQSGHAKIDAPSATHLKIFKCLTGIEQL